MNLVDKLLKSDAKKADELEKKIIKSKKLARILGTDEAVDITIREIPTKRLNEIIAMQVDKKGKLDTSKMFDAKAILVAEGVIEPEVTNKDLLNHFNCPTPKDLVIKLFGNEITSISDEIAKLGGILTDEDEEEEIKN